MQDTLVVGEIHQTEIRLPIIIINSFWVISGRNTLLLRVDQAKRVIRSLTLPSSILLHQTSMNSSGLMTQNISKPQESIWMLIWVSITNSESVLREKSKGNIVPKSVTPHCSIAAKETLNTCLSEETLSKHSNMLTIWLFILQTCSTVSINSPVCPPNTTASFLSWLHSIQSGSAEMDLLSVWAMFFSKNVKLFKFQSVDDWWLDIFVNSKK